MANPTLGVVLLNMGGPDRLEDVPPYLRNIFRDPYILDMPLGFLVRPWLSRIIVNKRAPASADRYRQIGGKTPLNAIAAQQAEALTRALAQRGCNALAAPGMRYWHPFTAEALAQFAQAGVDLVVALSMYPAYCRATSGSSLQDFHRAVRAQMPKTPAFTVEAWPDLPAYADFLAQEITTALDTLGPERLPRTAVLFSAHSVPQKLIQRGDPYKRHIEQSFWLACEKLPHALKAALGWQSAAGPAKWLEPETKQVAAALRREGFEHLVVVPLGFVAENIETLWDIEIDLKSFAREQGFQEFIRIACPNDNAAVLDALAERILATIG